jgi:hypothetical protein
VNAYIECKPQIEKYQVYFGILGPNLSLSSGTKIRTVEFSPASSLS